VFRSGRSFASNLGGVDDEMDTTSSSRPYVFPAFYRYPPYFTVQPVAETFQKQRELWSSLILSYCTHHKMHVIDVFDDGLELFRNREIERHLVVTEKRVFLDALEQDHNGRKGRWLTARETGAKGSDAVQKCFFLVLWRPLEESVLAWMDGNNECEDVMLLESLVEGLGMDGWTWGEGLVRGALEALERERRVKVFTHRNGGRKFLAVKKL